MGLQGVLLAQGYPLNFMTKWGFESEPRDHARLKADLENGGEEGIFLHPKVWISRPHNGIVVTGLHDSERKLNISWRRDV